jgi:protein-L-isoaspartate(D-aspartate) O-methyltransferase
MTAATASLATARTNMVENQVRTNDVTDLEVQDAMRAAPRERLCPPGRAALAYAEARIAYAPDWTLAEPREVSKLLQALSPRAGERALAIAAPYAAMVMARIGLHVTALQPPEGAPDFLLTALAEEGVAHRVGRLETLGELGPFDVMITEGGVERAPQAWTDALAEGGRLGVVERSGPTGKARLYLRGEDGALARREIFDATPPMMPGFAARRGFSL